ncbi:MAG: hypothetical protein ACKVUS_13605 [Saprospiraceae bacterium]
MKKLAALATALCCFAQIGFAQYNFGKLIGGLEMGFDVSQLTDGIKPRFVPSFQLEVPIGSLALGAGIGRKYYREYEYPVFAGQVIQKEQNGVLVTLYKSNIRAFKPAYWTVPIKAEVRVHKCQCVYLQAGMAIDFLDAGTPDRLVFSGAELPFQSYTTFRHDQLFKKRTTSFMFGIGFNLFRTEGFRLTARPSIVWSQNPEIYSLYAEAPDWIPTLRMNFGAQVAIVR